MLLFPDATRAFIQATGPQKTSKTIENSRATLRRLQGAHPGQSLDQFTTDQLTQFCFAGRHAPNTVRTRKTLIRTFFEWATWHKLLKQDPAIGLKFTVKSSSGGVRQHHWLSEHDVATVLRSLPSTEGGQRDKIGLMAGFMMGLRSHEIAMLRWSHFSHDLSQARGIGKGAKVWQLGVPAQFQSELAAWRSQAPAGCDVVLPWISKNWGGIAPVWSNAIGVNGVTNIVDNAVISSGIMFKPHDMRRTFAGILEEKGVDIKDISRLLRHGDIGITSTYLESNPRKTAALGHGFTLEL